MKLTKMNKINMKIFVIGEGAVGKFNILTKHIVKFLLGISLKNI